jgi:hypothetical protein
VGITVKNAAGLFHVLLSAGAHVNQSKACVGPPLEIALLQKLLVLEGLFCQYANHSSSGLDAWWTRALICPQPSRSAACFAGITLWRT